MTITKKSSSFYEEIPYSYVVMPADKTGSVIHQNNDPYMSLLAGDLMWYWPDIPGSIGEPQMVMVLKDWDVKQMIPNRNGDVFMSDTIEVLFEDTTIRVITSDLYETKETCNLCQPYSILSNLKKISNNFVQSMSSDIAYSQDLEILDMDIAFNQDMELLDMLKDYK